MIDWSIDPSFLKSNYSKFWKLCSILGLKLDKIKTDCKQSLAYFGTAFYFNLMSTLRQDCFVFEYTDVILWTNLYCFVACIFVDSF